MDSSEKALDAMGVEHRSTIYPGLRLARRRTGIAFAFTTVHLIIFSSFILNWTGFGAALSRPVGVGPMTGSLLLFITLILTLVFLEVLFLLASHKGRGT